jgi:hypothetical protein
MSHVKNVEAFTRLIGFCTGLGENYAPGQQNLSVPSLNSTLNNARLALNNVQDAANDLANATNTREVVFESMRKLAQRVVSELMSSGVPDQTLADARALNRKLAGYRISRDPIPDEAARADKKSRRARGSDFITRAESFSMLIRVVSSVPKYNPVREELKVASLETTAAGLMKANDDVSKAYAALTHARRYRNEVLYRATDNMAELSRYIKSHVRAMVGYGGAAYKTVAKIKISNS